jgi:CO dehydrogenase maturation factor
MAIDADSSPNLALTLGMTSEEARSILPLCENRELVQQKTGSGFNGVFRVSFAMDDVVASYSVKTPAGAYLLVMGTVRGMGTGCTCPAHTLVRNLLRSLLTGEYQAVIVDMEAGVEHLGRGTAAYVDMMLIVTDASLKSLETARTIHTIASTAGIRQIYLLGNRIRSGEEMERVQAYADRYVLPLLAMIPYDSAVSEADILGYSPVFLSTSAAMQAVDNLTEEMVRRQE